MREVVRGHALQHGGGGLAQLEARGNLHQKVRRHRGVFGVAATRHGPGDVIASSQSTDTFAESFDGTRAFHAQHGGERNLVKAGALIDVDKIHARRGELHQYLAGGGFGLRQIAVTEDAGVAVLFDENSFHVSRILRLVCTTAAKSNRKASEKGNNSRRPRAGAIAEPLSPRRTRRNSRMFGQWPQSTKRNPANSLMTKSFAGRRAANIHFHLVMMGSFEHRMPTTVYSRALNSL